MATTKQLKAARIISENPRKSVSAAMREAGYSDRSAEKPQELTRSQGWQELMADLLPDERLLQVHRSLLNSKDWRARANALDKAYKLKGRYSGLSQQQEDPYENMSLEELEAMIAEQEDLLERYRKYPKKVNNHADSRTVKY